MSDDLAATMRAITERLDAIERSIRLPTQRISAKTALSTTLTPTLGTYADFAGAASVTVDVPPTGSIAIWVAADPWIEAPSGFYGLYLSPALSGSNTLSAGNVARLVFATGGIHPRPVWFQSLTGLNAGPTTFTFQSKYEGTSPPTLAGFAAQVMMIAPIWQPPDPLTPGSWEHLVS